MYKAWAVVAFLIFSNAAHSQGLSDNPNLLMGEAIDLYSQGVGASGEERTRLLTEVDAILKRIESDFPDSVPATFMKTGQPLGPIDTSLLERELSDPLQDLPEATRDAIMVVASRACQAANCRDEVATSLAEFVLDVAFTDAKRAVDVEKLKWLFSNPGQLGDNLERVEVFEEMLDDPAVLTDIDGRIANSLMEDLGKEAAKDLAIGLVTNVATEVVANWLEQQGKTEEAALARAWIEPSVDIGLALQGAATATMTSAGTGAAIIWAKNAYSFVQLGQKALEAEAAGATRDQQLAKIGSDIDSLHRTLITGKTTGPLFNGNEDVTVTPKMAEVFQQTLADNYEYQKYWLSSNDAILLESFDFLVEKAKAAARLTDAVVDAIPNVPPTQPAGTENANSTNALPGDIDLGAMDAPSDAEIGFGIPSASVPVDPDWTFEADKATIITPGESLNGIELRADNSILAFGKVVLPTMLGTNPSYAAISQTQDGDTLIITQTVPQSDGWEARLAIVSSDPARPVFTVAGGAFRFDNNAVLSNDGNFAIMRYSFEEFASHALLVDLRIAKGVLIKSNRPSTQVSNAMLDSVRLIGDRIHGITFSHLECAKGGTACGMAFIKDAGTTEVKFRLPEIANAPDAPTNSNSSAGDQVALLEQLKSGLYAIDAATCARKDENVGEQWGNLFKSIRKPEFSAGYERTCTIKSTTDFNGSLKIDAACNAEGELMEMSHTWKVTSTTTFTDVGARNGPQDWMLCEAEKPATGTTREWTPGIVFLGTLPQNCMNNPTPECLSAAGASEQTISFVVERNGAGIEAPGVLPRSFLELGKVDIAYLDSETNRGDLPYFVNTAPQSITWPDFPISDLNKMAGWGDLDAQAILRKFPNAQSWAKDISGMRLLPTGHQRFSLESFWSNACRACPNVGSHVINIDFDSRGKFKAFTSQGIMNLEKFGSRRQFTASELQREPALLQYILNLRGYEAGAMDGALGAKSKKALADFQKEQAINFGTGSLDPETLAALANEATMFTNGTLETQDTPRSPFVTPGGTMWIQTASSATEAEAIATAQELAGKISGIELFQGVKIFQASNGWYAITAGRIFENAFSEIERFKASGIIPKDALLVNGDTYVREIAFPSQAGGRVSVDYELEFSDTFELMRTQRMIQGISASLDMEFQIESSGLRVKVTRASGHQVPGANFNPTKRGTEFQLKLNAVTRKACTGCKPAEVFHSAYGMELKNDTVRGNNIPVELFITNAAMEGQDEIGFGLVGSNQSLFIVQQTIPIAAIQRAQAKIGNASFSSDLSIAPNLVDLTLKNSGPDLFNIFEYAQADFCAGKSCYYLKDTKQTCQPGCKYSGVEGTYLGRKLTSSEVSELLSRTGEEMTMYVQQGIPRGHKEAVDRSKVNSMEAYRFFRDGCTQEACSSMLVLMESEYVGYVLNLLPESETLPEAAAKFTVTKTLRDTWLLSRYFRDNNAIYDQVDLLPVGSDVKIYGVYGEDCLADGHEGVFIKCADVAGFDTAGSKKHSNAGTENLPVFENATDSDIDYFAEYEKIGGDRLVNQVIASSSWENSEKQRLALARLVELAAESPRKSNDLQKVSVMTWVLGQLTENATGSQVDVIEVLNYARNIRQGPHPTYEQIESEAGWNKASPGEKEFHVIGFASPDLVEKYTTADGREAVFELDANSNWVPLVDGTNDATYNFVPGNFSRLRPVGSTKEIYQHILLDVIPWIIWGVSLEDRTTISERIAAFERSTYFGHLETAFAPRRIFKDDVQNEVSTNSDSSRIRMETASASELSAMLRAFGITAENASIVSGDASSQEAEARQLISLYKNVPPLVTTPELLLSSNGFDADTQILTVCATRTISLPNDLVASKQGLARLVVAPADPITGFAGLPALCVVNSGEIRKAEALHGTGIPERFSLFNSNSLALRFAMKAEQASVFNDAMQNGSARIRVDCEMFEIVKKPYTSYRYNPVGVGTCVPKNVTLVAHDYGTGASKSMQFSADGKVFQPLSGLVVSIAPKSTTPPKDAKEELGRVAWSFESSSVGEDAVRDIVEGFVGEPVEIILGYQNAFPFQTEPSKQLANEIFALLPQEQVSRMAGTRAGFGSHILKAWSGLNDFYFKDDPEADYASAIIGKAQEIRILSIKELSGSSCEWSVTYRVWLEDVTPFGTALAATNSKDGLTFTSCFRTIRQGYEVVSYEYVD